MAGADPGMPRQLFGTKSEKTKAAPDDAADGTESQPVKTTVKGHTQTKKKKAIRDERYADIPVRDVIIPVPDKDRRCTYCNAEMILLSHKEVRTELCITPAKVERVRYMQEELICPECRKDGDGTIVQAQTPAPLLAHGLASPSVVAYVMFDKSFVSVPYYRQEACMAQPGLELPRETMANWYIKCALECSRKACQILCHRQEELPVPCICPWSGSKCACLQHDRNCEGQ